MWQFWVDRGGTFTDIVSENPRGQAAPPINCCRRTPEAYEGRCHIWHPKLVGFE